MSIRRTGGARRLGGLAWALCVLLLSAPFPRALAAHAAPEPEGPPRLQSIESAIQAASFSRHPLPVVVRGIKGLGSVFFERGNSADSIIDALIGYAAKSRKNGIVSLEKEAAAIADPFMRKALNLAVDGTDLQELRKMMDTDISLSEQAAEADARMWEAAGGYAPTIGIIGAVLGLIQVMKHLEDIKEVGHGIAVAFVATVYGVGSANILFLPAANKMRARIRQSTIVKEMVLEGVVGIVEGLNPTLIRMKLEAFNPNPRKRKSADGAKLAASPKPAAPAVKPIAAAGS